MKQLIKSLNNNEMEFKIDFNNSILLIIRISSL